MGVLYDCRTSTSKQTVCTSRSRFRYYLTRKTKKVTEEEKAMGEKALRPWPRLSQAMGGRGESLMRPDFR